MPRRSNRFQRLIYLLHSLLSDSAEVEESLMVRDRTTGELREIDIGIRSDIGGYPILVAVECTERSRPAGTPWVEEMWGKHASLPTSELVLISASGFSGPALAKAKSYGVTALTLSEAT